MYGTRLWFGNDDNAVLQLPGFLIVLRSLLFIRNASRNPWSTNGCAGFSGMPTCCQQSSCEYYELGDQDVVLTVLTDSMELYGSRIQEMHEEYGTYTEYDAAEHYARYLHGVTTDATLELTYNERRRVHDLKYYTWVEQQGKTYEEILAQWYEKDYWAELPAQIPEIDALINEFNAKTGLIDRYGS